MAAYYPDQPDALRKVQARRFFDALGDLYPCTHCAEDFRRDINRDPPRVESRTALSVWLCERHNEVNEKLGKEKHSCAIAELDKRWLKGPSTCWHG
jgi:FAD-linked sulfhydryl oxidase